MTSENNAPLYLGHRQRMRLRLKNSGSLHLETYELLEMLLYHAIPRIDTHMTAKLLLKSFGSLRGIFEAKREELLKIKGIGEGAADFIVKASEFINLPESSLEEDVRMSFKSYKQTGNFFKEYFKDKTEHETVLLLLDSSLSYVDFKKIYDLDLSSGGLHTKPFITLAVGKGAAVAVVAHNHPNSIAFPTAPDWESAKLLKTAFEEVGITLLESYVISGDKYCGFLSHMPTEFSQRHAYPEFFDEGDAE